MHDGLTEHILFILSGSTALGLIAHAVSTFPIPENKYAQWLLGVIQYVVGQRMQAQVTLGAIKQDEKKQQS